MLSGSSALLVGSDQMHWSYKKLGRLIASSNLKYGHGVP